MKRSVLVGVIALGCKGKGGEAVELGTAVHPFGLVANVWLGMTPDEVKQKAPELRTGPSYSSADPDRASYTVRYAHGQVAQIHMQLMKRSADDLWKAWGPGTSYGGAPTERRRYFDEARGARADVSVVSADSFAVDIVPMTPLARLLDGPDTTAIAGVPLIGRQVKDVVADLKTHHLEAKLIASDGRTMGDVELPSTEWTTLGELTFWTDTDGVVNHWALIAVVDPAGAANPAARSALLGVYERRWGKPVEAAGGFDYGTSPKIHVDGTRLMPEVTVPAAAAPPPPPASPPPPPAR